MIKKGVILVLLFSFLAQGGKKSAAPAIFRQSALDNIYHSCPRPDSGKFVVKTVDKKGLDDLLSESFQLLANPFDRIVLGSSTLAFLEEDRTGPDIFSATVCRREGPQIQNKVFPGKISVWLGQAPVVFSPEKHIWLGPVCRTEWNCRPTQMVENIRLVRQVAMDRFGGCLISFRLAASTKAGREQLKEFRFKGEILKPSPANYRTWFPQSNVDVKPSSWRIWLRLPDGSLKRLTSSGTSIECPAGPEELLIGVKWIDAASSNQTQVGPEEINFEQQLVKSHPITGLMTAGKKWIARTFPAWDSPEPWLNKLWAAQVFTLYSSMTMDEPAGLIRFEPVFPLVRDCRWLRDQRIALGTILAGLDDPPAKTIWKTSMLAPAGFMFLQTYPDPDLKSLLNHHALTMTALLQDQQPRTQRDLSWELLTNYLVLEEWANTREKKKFFHEKALALHVRKSAKRAIPTLENIVLSNYPVENYDDLIKWCRLFYVNGDFARAINLSLDRNEREMIDRLPRGVLDFIVTKLVGLRADGSDHLRIEPASWVTPWPYFAIDNLPYRGHNLTVAWQSPNGARRYVDMELGLNVFIDGKPVKRTQRLQPVEVELK